MSSQTPVLAGRVGAIYDIVVTVGFATPWTATFLLGVLAQVHDSLALSGSAMPDFETSHVLFVTLFGIVVTMWGVVRAIWPVPFLIAADTVGRAAFALAFIWALAAGHSTVIIAFLILETAFLVAQGLGVRKALKTDREHRVLSLPDEIKGPRSPRGVMDIPSATHS